MGYDPKKFDPSDPSTWPKSNDARRFTVDIARGIHTTDPSIPNDAENLRAHLTLLHQLNPDLLKSKGISSSVEDAKKTSSIVQSAVKKAVILLPQSGGKTSGIKLSEAIVGWEQYFQGINDNTKTQSSYFSVLRRFLVSTGDIAVNSITAEHIRNYRYSRNKEGVRIPTVDGDTSTLGRFFEWAKRDGHYPNIELPTQGQTQLSKTEREKQAKGADRFTLDELKRIFDVKIFTQENTKPHEFWMPLMALFTGARIEELAQLHLADIHYQDKVLIFDINDLGVKKVKTNASKRKVPVHPALVELGLLDYLKDVKETLPTAEGLFPYLTPTKHGRLSDRASKHWGYYLDKVKIKGREKVFHSFRDTVNNTLSDYGVTMELRCALVGHDINHVNIKQYRDPVPVRRLMEDGIGKICYERVEADNTITSLNLDPLEYVKGQFVERLKECVKEEEKQQAILTKKKARASIQNARVEQQKRRPGRPPKTKAGKTENNENDKS